jgi:pimeloyl-ACP methyl ester carboxylesterase
MVPGHELIRIRERKNATSALLFVHGFTGDSRQTWQEFPRILGTEEDLGGWDLFSLGYNTSFLPGTRGIWGADPEIPILATHFKTQLGITPLSTYRSLAIAAHSMGGLLVQRALVDDLSVASRLKHLFLFGTPSAGLKKAAIFERLLGVFVGVQIRNMAADGEFVTDLRARWLASFGTDPPFALFAIAGDRDQFVPPASSLAPFTPKYHRVIVGDHLSMVKPKDNSAESVRLILSALRQTIEPEEPSRPLRVAAQSPDFSPAGVALADKAQSGKLKFQEEATLVQAALVLDRENRREEAIKLLEQHKDIGTDAKGTLAGRIKRRWLHDANPADAQWALDLYAEALEIARGRKDDAQVFYHAINVAFLKLVAFDDSEGAREMAAVALEHAVNCEGDERQGMWSIATQAEASLYLGRVNDARRLYARLPKAPGVEHWQLLSAGEQAQYVAGKLKDTVLQTDLKQMFDPIPPARRSIFISYSHRDQDWLAEFQLVLKPFLTEWDNVDVWADTRIQPGRKWLEEIRKALDASKVAVLLVSADFLASDFIRREELPVLLEAAERGGVKLLWIYLSPAAYEVTPLSQFQAAHDIERPLESLSKVERREVLKKIASKIKEAVFE